MPTYTNADLERLHPYRHQLGGGPPPALPRANAAAREREDEARERASRERYWRQQAERHRERVLRLRERLAELRERLERERDRPPRRGQARSDHAGRALEARIERLVARLRELEWRFDERARREGALPGWLR